VKSIYYLVPVLSFGHLGTHPYEGVYWLCLPTYPFNVAVDFVHYHNILFFEEKSSVRGQMSQIAIKYERGSN
jgi:hypothetical protein